MSELETRAWMIEFDLLVGVHWQPNRLTYVSGSRAKARFAEYQAEETMRNVTNPEPLVRKADAVALIAALEKRLAGLACLMRRRLDECGDVTLDENLGDVAETYAAILYACTFAVEGDAGGLVDKETDRE